MSAALQLDDPLLEGGISGLQLVIRSGMNGYCGWTARQRFGQDVAGAVGRGPFVVVSGDAHSRLQRAPWQAAAL